MISRYFIYLSTISLILVARSVDAHETYVNPTLSFGDNNISHVNACRNDEWQIMRPHAVYDSSSMSLTSEFKELPLLSGKEQCDFEGVSCKVLAPSYGIPDPELINKWYASPYPTVYSKSKDGYRVIDEPRRLINRFGLAFIPINDAIDSELDIIGVETNFRLETARDGYMFFNFEGDHQFGEGKAICQVQKLKWGYSPATRCVITRYRIDGKSYVLGLVRRGIDTLIYCPISSHRYSSPKYASYDEKNIVMFKDKLINELTNAPLNFDERKIEVDYSKSGSFNIRAYAAPRVREKLYEEITLLLDIIPESNSFEIRFNFIAYTSKENRRRKFGMPDEKYYSKLKGKLENIIEKSYQSICEVVGKKLSKNNDVPGGHYECK